MTGFYLERNTVLKRINYFEKVYQVLYTSVFVEEINPFVPNSPLSTHWKHGFLMLPGGLSERVHWEHMG